MIGRLGHIAEPRFKLSRPASCTGLVQRDSEFRTQNRREGVNPSALMIAPRMPAFTAV